MTNGAVRGPAGPIASGTFAALLSELDLDALLRLGGSRRFTAGQRLMHQDEPGDRVLLLLQGHTKVTFLDIEGREAIHSFNGPGDVLGELSFEASKTRSSSVLAIEPVHAHALTAGAFRAYLEARPSAALTLIDVLGTRLREANLARAQFGASDTTGRIAARLVELCERYGDPSEGGIEIRLPITQADLGAWTASSLAGVTEALRTMRELGWLRTGRRRITVLDLDALFQRGT